MKRFALELAIERFEAELTPALDAHSAAMVAALRTGAATPPWPSALGDDRAARLARDAAALGEPVLMARARTLARWSLAARLGADRELRDAHREPRTLAGLATRHAALRAAAARIAGAALPAVLATLYGAAPTLIAPIDDAPARDPDRAAWPTVAALLGQLAEHAGTAAARVAVIAPSRTHATVTASHGVTCLLGAPIASGATLALAAHELGHGVYAAGFVGLPLGLAAPPTRIVDEAIAAWAVRSVAPGRAAQAAQFHARLARFEARAFGGDAIDAAWTAELAGHDPAALPALFDEPGAAVAYALADRLALAPAPGAIARWAQRGAAGTPPAAAPVA